MGMGTYQLEKGVGMGTCQLNRLAASLLILAVAAACGGGGGDGDNTPTFQVSGRVTTDSGAPVANAEIWAQVRQSCPGGPTFFGWGGGERTWGDRGTSNASGEYVVTVVLNNSCRDGIGPMRMQTSIALTCYGDKQLPCYSGDSESWEQSDLSPKQGVNLVVSPKSRISGTIQFPNGINNTVLPTYLLARLTPSDGPLANVDATGRFWFTYLEPGSYTVDFPPDACFSSLFQPPCNSSYAFTPPSITVDIVAPGDTDISFSAVPK